MPFETSLNWSPTIRRSANEPTLSLYRVHKIDMLRKSILGQLSGLVYATIRVFLRCRAPLPPSIGDLLKKRLRHFHLASNPVRLQYCTQEIVVFREDLLQKLCRYCIKLPSDNLPMHVRCSSVFSSEVE
jgi:hypothetical protein